MAFFLDSLPIELKRKVVSLVQPGSELKSLRLVNKTCSLLASECLFGSVNVRFQERSLQKLLAISRHTSLKYLVTEIIYEADGDPRHYWIPSPRAHRLDLIEAEDRPMNGDRYLGIVLDETSQLSAAICNLPNVLNVQFQSLTHLDPATATGADREAHRDREAQTHAVLGLPGGLRGDGVRSFFAVMRAATVAETELQYVDTGPSLYGIHYSFLEQRGIEMQHTSDIFAHLKRLAIYLNTEEGKPESQVVLSRGFLAQLLTSATELQSIGLGFDQRPDEGITFMNILGPGVWPALRKFNIHALDFHLWEMSDFVERHPEIAQMGLANCKLHSGSFEDLLVVLRDDLSLDSVLLDGALGDADAEYDFFESSRNRQNGTDFVLGVVAHLRLDSKTPEIVRDS